MKKRRINYTVIAKSVPEWSKKDNCIYTCSIGISPELGLIRVYPLPIKGLNKFETWSIEVERNKMDSRGASWKLSSMARKEEWTTLSKDCYHVRHLTSEDVYKYLTTKVSNSISDLNKMRESIGVIKINGGDFRADWVANSKHKDTSVLPLFDDVGIEVEVGSHCRFTKHLHDKELRIKFKDADGLHDLQYNEWHYYEGQRKLGALPSLLQGLNKVGDLLLLGNMLQYQTNWIGLGKFKTMYKNQLQLFK